METQILVVQHFDKVEFVEVAQKEIETFLFLFKNRVFVVADNVAEAVICFDAIVRLN